MPLGPLIRAKLGRHERRAAEVYRSVFLDVEDFAGKILEWAPGTKNILEVGCGEGLVTEWLSNTFPDAEILAIDITPRVGRLYRARAEGVAFRCTTVQDIARDNPGQFDLVILADVLHHVPLRLRTEIIQSIQRAMAPDARFILKDWGRGATPIHWLAQASDRWLTGDRVNFLTSGEAKNLVEEAAPMLEVVSQGYVKPWRSNYALVFAC